LVLKHEGYSGYTKKHVNEKKIIDAHGQKLKSVVRNKETGTKKYQHKENNKNIHLNVSNNENNRVTP
jgi:hypothetical protein